MLVNLAEQRRLEMVYQRLHKARVSAPVLKVVRDGMSEGDSGLFAPDAFGQDFSFALCPDFFGKRLVSNACAFFNALSPDCAAHDPVGSFWTLDEFEGHDATSYSLPISSCEKRTVRPIFLPTPWALACLSKVCWETEKSRPLPIASRS